MSDKPPNLFSQLLQQQPLAVAAVLFLFGLSCGYRVSASVFNSALLVALLATIAAVVLLGRKFKGAWLLPFLVIALGMARAEWDQLGRQEECALLTAYTGYPIELTLRVDSEVTRDPRRRKNPRYLFSANAIRIQPVPERNLPGHTISHVETAVYWFGYPGQFPCPGERWSMRGKLVLEMMRNGFPRLIFTSREGKDARRLSTPAPSEWLVRLNAIRLRAAQLATYGIEQGIGGQPAIPTLNKAIILGTANEIPRNMKRIFADSGTVHVFAISGLHIMLVAGFIHLILTYLGVSRLNEIFILAPLLIAYTLLTGARPSAIRACIMAIVYMLAPRLGRRPNGLTSLVFTALLVHVVEPDLIYNAGSLFSFTVMAGLVLFLKPFTTFFTLLMKALRSFIPTLLRYCKMIFLSIFIFIYNHLPNRLQAKLGGFCVAVHFRWQNFCLQMPLWMLALGDQTASFLALFFSPADLWQAEKRLRIDKRSGMAWLIQKVRLFEHFLIGSFAVSLAAWIASIPLTAYYFGRFTPGSLLANLVIAPSAGALMSCGCLGLFASLFCMPLAWILNHLTACFTWLMIQTASLTANCPCLTFKIVKWEVWQVTLFYMALALLAWLFYLDRHRDRSLDWIPKRKGGLTAPQASSFPGTGPGTEAAGAES